MLFNPSEYNHTRFNQLPSIEAADEEMRRSGTLDLALSVLGPVFLKHGVEEDWGICILHRHWPVARSEIPVESQFGREFHCRPIIFSQKMLLWPRVLSVTNAGDVLLEPLEFSTDEYVRSANAQLRESLEFVKEFATAVRRLDLVDTFGLTAIKRAYDESLELLEFNFDARISVVREVCLSEFNPEGQIQTAWCFSRDATSMACTKSCFRRCVDSGSGHRFQDHAKVHSPS